MRSDQPITQFALFADAEATSELGSLSQPPGDTASQADDEFHEEAPTWTAFEADQLRQVLLTQTLETIQDGRNAAETIEECWAWILSEADGGFAFRTCAIEAGCDPDELREMFDIEMRRQRSAHEPDDGQLALTERPWDWLRAS